MTASIIDLAARLRLHRSGREWRGPCPACGYESDPFVIRVGGDGRPLAFCASCRDRDAIRLALSRASGGTWTPPAPRDEARDAAQEQRRQARALALWCGSDRAAGTFADRYLTARGLPGLAASDALRSRLDCPHPKETARLPAMLALVTNATGAPVAIHRTYLRRDGSGKADVEPVKASLGPIWGGAIRLDPLAPELVIGEGIESSASAGRMLGLPAWSALSAGNLACGLVLPPEVRRVVIAADHDAPNRHGQRPGQAAARDAWHRWHAEGRRVRIATPDGSGDFNDVLRAREANHA